MAVPEPGVPALPEGLDAVELAFFNDDVLGVPQCRAAELGELAPAESQAPAVPEGVAQVAKAVLGDDIGALL